MHSWHYGYIYHALHDVRDLTRDLRNMSRVSRRLRSAWSFVKRRDQFERLRFLIGCALSKDRDRKPATWT